MNILHSSPKGFSVNELSFVNARFPLIIDMQIQDIADGVFHNDFDSSPFPTWRVTKIDSSSMKVRCLFKNAKEKVLACVPINHSEIPKPSHLDLYLTEEGSFDLLSDCWRDSPLFSEKVNAGNLLELFEIFCKTKDEKNQLKAASLIQILCDKYPLFLAKVIASGAFREKEIQQWILTELVSHQLDFFSRLDVTKQEAFASFFLKNFNNVNSILSLSVQVCIAFFKEEEEVDLNHIFQLLSPQRKTAFIQHLMGFCCEQCKAPINHQALEFYKEALRLGSHFSFYRIALLYRNGKAVKQSDELAAHYFLLGARFGCSKSMLQIGLYYLEGSKSPQVEALNFSFSKTKMINPFPKSFLVCTEKNWQRKALKEAYFWFRNGHQKGNSVATHMLGVMHGKGLYVQKNWVVAMEYYRLASEAGVASSRQNFEHLEKRVFSKK